MSRHILTLFFLNIFLNIATTQDDSAHDSANEVFLMELEKKLENKFFEYADGIVKWLENIKKIYNSDLEKVFSYREIQPKLGSFGSEARGSHKMLPYILIPIVFKIGAMSTMMLLTTFLAAKSVAIGLLLLVFKIVVSSVKAASLFTIWKVKKYHHELPWPVHHEYHDHHGHYDHHDIHGHYDHHDPHGHHDIHGHYDHHDPHGHHDHHAHHDHHDHHELNENIPFDELDVDLD